MARKPVSYLAGAALLGTAIGAIVGVLAAPRSGPELRKAIGDAGRELPQRLAELPTRGVERLRQLRRRDPGTRVTVEGAHAATEEE